MKTTWNSTKKTLQTLLVAGTFMTVFGANAAKLDIEGAWAKPTFALAKMGAGYFTLTNNSDADIAITGLSLPERVASKVELHETYLENDMAKMRPLTMPFVIKSGTSVEFVPRGKHLMIMGLKKPLEVGHSVELTLALDSGESQTVIIPVQEKAGKGEDNDGHAHHRHHH